MSITIRKLYNVLKGITHVFQNSPVHEIHVHWSKGNQGTNDGAQSQKTYESTTASNNIYINKSKKGVFLNGISAAPESYPAVDFKMTVMSPNPSYLTSEGKFSKTMKNIRILGLMAVISYMIVILLTWMYANFDGYVYFLAGEPNMLVKYTEWALGLTGIFVAVDFLHKEINEII